MRQLASVAVALAALSLGLVTFVACVGDDPGVNDGASSSSSGDGGGSSGASSSGASSSGASSSGASSSGASSSGTSGSTNQKLTVVKEGDAGVGTLTSAPTGIDCGSACSADFANGSKVTVTATGTGSDMFMGWTQDGVLCAAKSTCDVTMDAPKTVGGLFVAPKSAGWVAQAKSTGSEGGSRAALDKDGNIIYAVGFSATTFTFQGKNYNGLGSSDIFLAKLSPTGAVIWAKVIGGSGFDGLDSLSVNANGEIGIVGSSDSPTVDFGGGKTITITGAVDLYVAKVSASDGSTAWAKRLIASDDDDPGIVGGIDNSGNILVAGHAITSIDLGDGAVSINTGEHTFWTAKYAAANGALSWKRVNYTSVLSTLPNGVAVDSAGDMVVVGELDKANTNFGSSPTNPPNMSPSGNRDIFVVKFDGINGNQKWQKQIGGSGDEEGGSVTLVDGTSNDLIVTVSYPVTNGVAPSFAGTAMTAPTASSFDWAIGRLSSTGTVTWAKRFGSTANDFVYTASALANDRVAVTGYIAGDATFDAQPTITFGGSGGDSVFAVLDNAATTPTASWSFKVGGAALDTGETVVGRGKLLYGFGKFQGDGLFFNTTLTNAGLYDGYAFGAVTP